MKIFMFTKSRNDTSNGLVVGGSTQAHSLDGGCGMRRDDECVDR